MSNIINNKSGISMDEMLRLQQEKIEELYLHIIQLSEKLEILNLQLSQLNK
jgi:hypothetical protein